MKQISAIKERGIFMIFSRRCMILVPFVLMLMLSMACLFPFMLGQSHSTAKTGTLSVDINYMDTFYRETFNYTRDAPNIKHFVLVLPESEANRATVVELLYSIRFPENSGDPWITDPAAQWAEQYLYEAPGARFTGEFAPGDYELAAVFIAGPVSADEAGVEEGTLYAGMTGGGANTDFQPIHISEGQEAQINITMTDANGWACPWLYVFNGDEYERRTEILRNFRDVEQTEITDLGAVPVVSSALFLRISEEKAETTHLDQLYLIVNGERIVLGDLALDQQDDRYVSLEQGATLDLRFNLPENLALEDRVNVTVVAAGYYVAD